MAAKRASFSDRDIGTLTRPAARTPSAGDDTPSGCGRASPWSTPAPRSSRPRRPTSTPPTPRPARRRRRRPCRARRRSSSAPARCASARASSSTTARCRPPRTLRADGQAAVMVNSNPETVSTDFDASSRLYFEPLDAESVLEVIDAEIRRTRATCCRRWSSSAARRRSTWRPPWSAAGVHLPGLDAGDHRAHRGAHALRAARRPAWASRSRRAAWRPRCRRRSPSRRGRLPGDRAAVVRHRRPGHRLLLRTGGPGAPAGDGHDRERGPAGAHRRLPRGPRGGRRCRVRRP